jgi:hypothetical protein
MTSNSVGLRIIVNVACFISFWPEDTTDDSEGEPPAWVLDALKDPSETRRARDRKRDAADLTRRLNLR